jgi:nitrite reductase/ring-hydroxylating ferredoxin subunit
MPFVRTVKLGELPPGTVREFSVEGRAIALANVEGKIYAINNICLHHGGPLGQGMLEGKAVTCPWHSWQFDVTEWQIAAKSLGWRGLLHRGAWRRIFVEVAV